MCIIDILQIHIFPTPEPLHTISKSPSTPITEGVSVHLFIISSPSEILLAPVMYGVPTFLSLYLFGGKSCPDNSCIKPDILHHSQLSGISKGISSSEMGVSTRSFFFSFPSFTSRRFSSRIRSSRALAGSSLGSCGTRRPSMASWSMEFLNCCAFMLRPLVEFHSTILPFG